MAVKRLTRFDSNLCDWVSTHSVSKIRVFDRPRLKLRPYVKPKTLWGKLFECPPRRLDLVECGQGKAMALFGRGIEDDVYEFDQAFFNEWAKEQSTSVSSVSVNDTIPPNPHPVQPPPNMPPPKKKDEKEDIDWKRKCEDLESEIMILKSNIVVIGQAFDRFENGLLNTPDWVKQADLRDTINKSRHFR